MNRKEQREYWLKFHRFQLRYENLYYARVNRALKNQVQQYIDKKDLLYVRSGELYGVLLELYKQVGSVWARHTRRIKAAGQMGFSERIVMLMRQYYGIDLLNDAEGITDTTKAVIQRVLEEAAEAGWSFDEIVRKIDGINRNRASLIARTETVTAANGAAMINAKELGIPLNKIWISATDNRTRRDHYLMNRVTVGINDNFIVGGFPMQQPGDRTQGAPAKEICNCRCVVAFVPV